MSSEYDKKNEPGQGQRDDKSSRPVQGGREGTDKENPREGQGGSQTPGGSQRKPGESDEAETE